MRCFGGVAVCCSVLQYVAVCCSMLQRVAVCSADLRFIIAAARTQYNDASFRVCGLRLEAAVAHSPCHA